jgi:hypothetical protein
MRSLLSIIILFVVQISFATQSVWQCTSQDKMNQSWSVQNNFQKVAFNLALTRCKKESQLPLTCSRKKTNCTRTYEGSDSNPMWECTALDDAANPWRSNPYLSRDDAALAAQAYCKEKSRLPDTCFINLITCKNTR